MASLGRDQRTDTATRDALDQAAKRAAEKATKKTARSAVRAYFVFVLIVFAGAVAYQVNMNRKLDSASDRLERSEIRACERLQAQRERTNVSEARQFLLLDAVTKSPRASTQVKTEYGSLSETTLYDPPTDCKQAIERPGDYQRPASIPYARLPKRFVEAVVNAANEGRPQPTPTR